MRSGFKYALISISSIIVGAVLVVGMLLFLASKLDSSDSDSGKPESTTTEEMLSNSRNKACRALYELHTTCHGNGKDHGFMICMSASRAAFSQMDHSVPDMIHLTRSIARQGCKDGSSGNAIMPFANFEDAYCTMMDNLVWQNSFQ